MRGTAIVSGATSAKLPYCSSLSKRMRGAPKGQLRFVCSRQLGSQEGLRLADCEPKEDLQSYLQHKASLGMEFLAWDSLLSCRGEEHQGVAHVPALAQSWVASGAGRVWRGALVNLHSHLLQSCNHREMGPKDVGNVASPQKRPYCINSPTPAIGIVAACRNCASGARWSGCIAAFRTYPEPNMDPIGYLRVGPRNIAHAPAHQHLHAVLLCNNCACPVLAVLTCIGHGL